jgi:deoxyribonuclease-4
MAAKKKKVVRKPATKQAKRPPKRSPARKAPAKKSPARKAFNRAVKAVKRVVAKATASVSRPKRLDAPPPLTERILDHPGQPPLGAHVSTAGGLAMAPERADNIGATAMQIFTKTPNQWKEPKVGPEEAAAFRTALAKSAVRFTTSHDSYLINLASPDKALRDRSIESFSLEVARCNMLGLDALVSHPGNFIDDRDSGIARNADGITQALEANPGPTRLLMEGTAGQGTVIGSTFEELAKLLELVPAPLRSRMGICLDTCHLYSAGFDLVNDYDGVWDRFDAVLGLDRLGCLHLNDSMTPFNSHRDRHELIGEGSIGKRPFARIMNDPRLAKVPKALETPKGEDMVTNDRKMLSMLRGFIGKPV